MFVVGSVTSLYLNVFVLIVQSFQRFPALLASAPKQKEPSFVITHLLVLGLFIWLGRVSVRGFRAAPVGAKA